MAVRLAVVGGGLLEQSSVRSKQTRNQTDSRNRRADSRKRGSGAVVSVKMHFDPPTIQEPLRARYERFRIEADVPPLLAPRMPSPLLLAVSDSWLASKFRILVVGQEVLGWGFAEGDYYDWPFRPIRNFKGFKTDQDAVEALIHGYRAFDYSKYQPTNARGCFWTGSGRFRRSHGR